MHIKANMLPINLLTPTQIKKQIAERAKLRRLEKNLSRESLAQKSGVPASTIKHFETTGNISIKALLALALVLDYLAEFTQLFLLHAPTSLRDIPIERKRGR